MLSIATSCENNHVEEALPSDAVNPCDTTFVSFNGTIAPLLTAKCATSGCHDGNGDDPNLSANMYNQLEPSLSDGKFKSKVIDSRTMPPSSETPLTALEYQTIKCWFEAGHNNN